MQASICNKAHPDYGCATIPLPIPDAEYAHCIELLEELDVGSDGGLCGTSFQPVREVLSRADKVFPEYIYVS